MFLGIPSHLAKAITGHRGARIDNLQYHTQTHHVWAGPKGPKPQLHCTLPADPTDRGAPHGDPHGLLLMELQAIASSDQFATACFWAAYIMGDHDLQNRLDARHLDPRFVLGFPLEPTGEATAKAPPISSR